MMKKSMLTVAVFMVSLNSYAQDHRIRTVTYDPDAVIPIYTKIGNPTVIQFEEGENVAEESGAIGMGDAKAWVLNVKGNNIVLKPAAYRPDTQMVVVTNRRTYVFDFKSIRAKQKVQPTLLLRFDYPDSRGLLAQKEANKKAVLEGRMSRLPAMVSMLNNRNYMKRGDAALAPTEAYDDGEFTYLRFNNNRELPMVFKTMPDGSEALVNSHYDQDSSTLIIHETAKEIVLRLGNSVLGLRNDGYDHDGKVNASGTTIKNAVRIKKGDV